MGSIFIVQAQVPGQRHCYVPTFHIYFMCYQVSIHVSVTLEAMTKACVN
jgi:hypothetical protein